MAEEEAAAPVEADDEAASAAAEAAARAPKVFEPSATRTPTHLGHVQLVLDDGRRSDKAGAIVKGDANDIGASGAAFIVDQNERNMEKQRAADARQYLSAASKQKILDVLEELRGNLGTLLLP